MVNTPKNDFWKNAALTPTGVAAGSYGPAQITVDEFGRITNASNASVSTVSTISLVTQLATIIGPVSGELAVVLDDGLGNEEMYVWHNTNADLGAPLNRWRRIATTAAALSQRQDYRQIAIGIGANQLISSGIPDTGYVKRIAVEITTPYSPGTSIEIQDNAANVYMAFSSINPTLAGTYTEDLSGNLSNILTIGGAGQGQMHAIVGGVPGVGAGAVYIEWADA
jgi:hypothetical protein